jgi:hypothetical protein
MNDYLSNITARSFDRTEGLPLVSPRVPSLFEPLQAAREVSAEVESWPQADNVAGEVRRTELSSKADEWSGLKEEVQQTPHNAGRTLDAKSDEDAAEAVPGNAIQAFGNHERTLAPEIKEEQQITDRPLSTMEPVSKTRRGEEGTARSSKKTHEGPRIVENLILTERGKINAESESTPAPRNKPIVISPPTKPIPVPWQDTGHGGTPAKPESTIQVTIGRIEVRAVTQSFTDRPKPKGKPPMSLDEYLRGRSGGGR